MKIKSASFPILALVALICSFLSTAHASVTASGLFQADQSCQAYQSIRKKTNPGNIELEVGRQYAILELNVPEGTTWYRLQLDEAEPSQRWVYFECGRADVAGPEPAADGEPAGPQNDQPCSTAGLEDSYVLSLSWQPAFCESHPDKPECAVSDPESYQARNFTLHGLWPNQKSCGTHYGFCGQYAKEVSPFCDYAAVPMRAETLAELGRVMPSAAHGSCLQRHEWYKHGTCQTAWDADGYFIRAMGLVDEFNGSGMALFMREHLGRTVSTEDFFAAVDQAFFAGAHQRLQISCKNGQLVDVYLQLPSPLEDDSLAALLERAAARFRNGCGEQFEVDAIGP
ncbi:MAG: hypothetical protein P8X63_03710 [Desulfuromonadaceae bacterium]